MLCEPGMVLLSVAQQCGGCGRNEWNAAIIRAAAEEEGAMWWEEAMLSLRARTREVNVLGVCYGGICTVVWW